MHYPQVDFKNLHLTWRSTFFVAALFGGLYIHPFLTVAAFIAFLMGKQVVGWYGNLSRFGNPRISVGSVLSLLIGGFCLTLCYFFYLDALKREEREAPMRKAQHEKFAATICPRYFASNIVQRWNDGPAWCRDYPQFDRSREVSASKIDNATTASTTPVSSPSSLWK